MNFIICWIKDFIRIKWLFLLGNALLILSWILAGVGLFPVDQSWYMIVVVPLVGIIFTILFCSIKEYIFLKIIYVFCIIVLGVLMNIAILDLLEAIELPIFLNG